MKQRRHRLPSCPRCGGNIAFRYDRFICLQCSRAPTGAAAALLPPPPASAQMYPARTMRIEYYRSVARDENTRGRRGKSRKQGGAH